MHPNDASNGVELRMTCHDISISIENLMLHTTALFTFTSARAHTVQNNVLMAGKAICSSPRHHDSWVLHVLWHTALCYLVLHPPSHESFVQKTQHSALITAVSQCEHYCKLHIFATQRSTFFCYALQLRASIVF